MAVADVHGDLDQLDVAGCDIVIVAGDVGPGGTHHDEASKAWALDPNGIAKWFAKYPQTRFYILPGNHDLFAAHHVDRKAVRKVWPGNVHLINDHGFLDPIGLTIYGMPWHPGKYAREDREGVSGAFGADDKKISRKCLKVLEQMPCVDILVTHAPPKIGETELDVQSRHVSAVIGEMAKSIRPRLLICGHRHQSSHVPVVVNDGSTTVVNVAMKLGHGDSFAYRPRIIDVGIERKLDFAMDMSDDMRR